VELLHVFEFTSERRMMTVAVVLPDDPEGVYLLSKGADSSISPRCVSGNISGTTEAVNHFCKQGLRVMCVASKRISRGEWEKFELELEQAYVSELKGKQIGSVEEFSDAMETGFELLGCAALNDSLQEGVEKTLRTMKAANVKVSVITGDKMETAIGVAQGCGLITNRGSIYTMVSHSRMFGGGNFVPLGHLSELADFPLSASGTFEAADDTAKVYSVVVDGVALATAAVDPVVAQRLVTVINHPQCEGAIFCRVSPKQKGQVISMFRKYSSTDSRFLAVGDGANDMNMLRLSDVGVGITGKEGSQAANSADYAVRGFIDVYSLMFVHGRAFSYRLSNFVHLFLYKNCALSMCQIWYAFFSKFTAQSIFNEWAWLLFNCAFGLGGLLWACTSDNDVRVEREAYGKTVNSLSDTVWDEKVVAGLYKEAKNHFTKRSLFKWVILGIVHSLVIFFGCVMTFSGYFSDFDSDMASLGIVVYTSVLLVVSLMTLLYTYEWSKTFLASLIAGNLLLYAIYVVVYENVTRWSRITATWAESPAVSVSASAETSKTTARPC